MSSPALRTVHRVLGGETDPELRALLVATLFSTTGLSGFFLYQGIWAVQELGVSLAALGATLLVASILGGCAGYAGGHLSDRIGRKPVLVGSWALMTAGIATASLVGEHRLLGLTLIGGVLTFSAPGFAAEQALVADLVPAERLEQGFAAVRVTQNLGVALGPPLAGAALTTLSWSTLFLVQAAVGTVGVLLALLRVQAPQPRAAAHDATALTSLRTIRADRAYLAFLLAAVLAGMAFIASETVLPVAAVAEYDLSPSGWGLIAVLNPVMVVLLQMRVTRWSQHVAMAPKVVASLLLMGWPFLLLPFAHGLFALVAVVVVFVTGEMLWVPASQALAAAMAPEHLRGAYMGAMGGTFAVAGALGPFIGLWLLGAAGDLAAWGFFSAACTVAAITAGTVARRAATTAALRLDAAAAAVD